MCVSYARLPCIWPICPGTAYRNEKQRVTCHSKPTNVSASPPMLECGHLHALQKNAPEVIIPGYYTTMDAMVEEVLHDAKVIEQVGCVLELQLGRLS